jgi:hypothetical protein
VEGGETLRTQDLTIDWIRGDGGRAREAGHGTDLPGFPTALQM